MNKQQEGNEEANRNSEMMGKKNVINTINFIQHDIPNFGPTENPGC